MRYIFKLLFFHCHVHFWASMLMFRYVRSKKICCQLPGDSPPHRHKCPDRSEPFPIRFFGKWRFLSLHTWRIIPVDVSSW